MRRGGECRGNRTLTSGDFRQQRRTETPSAAATTANPAAAADRASWRDVDGELPPVCIVEPLPKVPGEGNAGERGGRRGFGREREGLWLSG